MNILWKPVSNYSSAEHDTSREKPTAIVLHIGEGNRNQIYNWFSSPQSRASSHYLVCSTGEIWQFVKDEDTAWHTGKVNNPKAELVLENKVLNPNSYTIGIENEGMAGQLISKLHWDSLIELTDYLCEKYSIPLDEKHIIEHKEINSIKLCPGSQITKQKVIEDVNKLRQIKANLTQQVSLLQKIILLLKQLLGIK